MRSCFPDAAKRVFGKNILIQYDYFHMMKIILYHSNRALAEYRRLQKEKGIYTLGLRETRWLILKNMDDWSFQQHQTMSTILSHYKNTIIEDIFILKQKQEIFS